MNPKLSLVIGVLCISFSPIFVKLAGVSPLGKPIFMGLLATFLLSEKLNTNEIIGSVIVLAGIAVTFLKAGNQSNKIVS
jgi:drug/metabolite transporter (DMT)-like permease